MTVKPFKSRCLLCGHTETFSDATKINKEDLLRHEKECPATDEQKSALAAQIAEPYSIPELITCPDCELPLGWVHPDDGRYQTLLAELRKMHGPC
jgi:hypothetical protein